MFENKIRYPSDALADIYNKFKYEQKKEWNVTILIETASTELKNNLKKELTKR